MIFQHARPDMSDTGGPKAAGLHQWTVFSICSQIINNIGTIMRTCCESQLYHWAQGIYL
jgi:hypothetical protein